MAHQLRLVSLLLKYVNKKVENGCLYQMIGYKIHCIDLMIGELKKSFYANTHLKFNCLAI